MTVMSNESELDFELRKLFYSNNFKVIPSNVLLSNCFRWYNNQKETDLMMEKIIIPLRLKFGTFDYFRTRLFDVKININ